jgi:hypothetical protein
MASPVENPIRSKTNPIVTESLAGGRILTGNPQDAIAWVKVSQPEPCISAPCHSGNSDRSIPGMMRSAFS